MLVPRDYGRMASACPAVTIHPVLGSPVSAPWSPSGGAPPSVLTEVVAAGWLLIQRRGRRGRAGSRSRSWTYAVLGVVAEKRLGVAAAGAPGTPRREHSWIPFGLTTAGVDGPDGPRMRTDPQGGSNSFPPREGAVHHEALCSDRQVATYMSNWTTSKGASYMG